MRITHHGHACLLVETPDARVLVDPGTWSPDWDSLTELDAVLVTHVHPDHVDWARLPTLLGRNPRARLLTEPAVADSEDGRKARAEPMPSGERTELGDLVVESVGGAHAVIHRDIPRIGNVGYVLRQRDDATLFHPGDSYEAVPQGVDVLAVPLNAPWAAAKETIDFARAVGPRVAVPIHDALLSETGRGLYQRLLSTSGGRDGATLEVLDLAGAGPHEL
ncbi:MAG: MBL fold metallo-hydrolase [Actinomycetes bacterium]